MRMPISKQRNKHIQHVLVEAAKLAPRYSHELALLREKEVQRGNKNRATLAIASRLLKKLSCLPVSLRFRLNSACFALRYG